MNPGQKEETTLEDTTTPDWEGVDLFFLRQEVSMPTEQKPKPTPTIHDWFAEIGNKVASGASLALIVAGIGWAVNVDRTQQEALHAMSAQTKSLEEIDRKLENLTAIDKRVSFIESTRFSRERGEEFDRRLTLIESRFEALEGKKK